MDARYTSDKIACVAKYLAELQSLLVEATLPFVDKGDPLPPWVQRELTEIGTTIKGTMQKAIRLVQLTKRVGLR
jgi:hypothetical protein